MLTEINFDGIIGPTHNYAGLSRGNIASASHAGDVSQPRAAALQGIEKMRHNLALGLPQGSIMPLDRPDEAWLETLGTSLDNAMRFGGATTSEWVLLELDPHLASGGYGHGGLFVWSPDGRLLATGSQTAALLLFD